MIFEILYAMRIHSFLLFILCFVLGVNTIHASNKTPKLNIKTCTHVAPEGTKLNDDFSVEILENGCWLNVPSYNVKVDQVLNSTHHVENASMAYFTIEQKTKVRIVSRKSKIESLHIRPLSANVTPTVNGDTILLEVTDAKVLSVEINDDLYHNLHLIPNPKYEAPKKVRKGPKTTIFGPGYHVLPDGVYNASSGETIYIAEGAWVEGGISVIGVENVHVYGPGVVRPKDRGYGVEIKKSRNVLVEGITTTQVPTGGSEYVTLRNIKCFTHYGWGDGMNIFASSHVVLDGCFGRNSDDCVTVYATRMGHVGNAQHIEIKNMTLWADVAHPIFIGLHGAAAYIADNKDRGFDLLPNAEEIVKRNDTISDILFSNIDILEQNEKQIDYQGCMSIVCGDNNVVKDVTFENIRVDSIRTGSLLMLRVFENEKYCKAPGKSISNVTFRNVSARNSGELSIIEGYNDERNISNITFENLQIDGVVISDDMESKPRWYKTTDMCRMLLGSFVEGITFKK